jgi:hypothetical protein
MFKCECGEQSWTEKKPRVIESSGKSQENHIIEGRFHTGWTHSGHESQKDGELNRAR